MSHQNYSLDIISHHPQFSGKTLRKYAVNGIDTIGAYGDENFTIVFKNNTWQKVQLILTIDGTDVFSGKPATTDPTNKMWVVNGYGELKLSAWCENDFGGAAFVFTSANNSVAIHTHGDLSSRGIIAAAVFTEGHVEPQRVVENHYHYSYPSYPFTWTFPYVCTNIYSIGSNTPASTVIPNNNSFSYNCSLDNMDSLYCEVDDSAAPAGRRSKSLESLAAVGAGQYQDQKISYVQGLIKPLFTETVRIKYVWWDELVAALRQNNVATEQPSGFPGDGNKHQHINLGSTPRLPKQGSFVRSSPLMYSRV